MLCFSSHSFRIDAATSAAGANSPDWLIKALGRWSSSCYHRYIRGPTNAIDMFPAQLDKASRFSGMTTSGVGSFGRILAKNLPSVAVLSSQSGCHWPIEGKNRKIQVQFLSILFI